MNRAPRDPPLYKRRRVLTFCFQTVPMARSQQPSFRLGRASPARTQRRRQEEPQRLLRVALPAERPVLFQSSAPRRIGCPLLNRPSSAGATLARLRTFLTRTADTRLSLRRRGVPRRGEAVPGEARPARNSGAPRAGARGAASEARRGRHSLHHHAASGRAAARAPPAKRRRRRPRAAH